MSDQQTKYQGLTSSNIHDRKARQELERRFIVDLKDEVRKLHGELPLPDDYDPFEEQE